MLLVCDGHGPNGADASEGVISTFLDSTAQNQVLAKCRESGKDALMEELGKLIREAEESVFISRRKGRSSGTTFTAVIVCGEDLAFTANVGDSRSCIAVEDPDGGFDAVDLTVDHVAAGNAQERERIEKAGGRISKFGGSHRVMSPTGECALAPTRSVGDIEFGQTVVIADPEVTEVKLTAAHKYIVTASDGLWEFLDRQTVMNQVVNCENVSGAAMDLVKYSQSEWFKTCGGYCDDISLVVCELPFKNWMDMRDTLPNDLAEQGDKKIQTVRRSENQEVIRCHTLTGLQN
eukprot:TRINITY_DN906_c0_g1_i1.p1 TRINITY_DN906_c0_g1~~TRINITY_DN906_c0_g1_i1.p1  ORF type:complete len:291 (-),score=75.12 TRINITY_DN906_c0_g1_i1:159-1031(-)